MVPSQSILFRRLETIVSMLDDCLSIPHTRFRIGLDGLVGLLPGLGDFITSIFSIYIIYAAALIGVPTNALIRMLGNVVLDSTFGTIPLLGDFFDLGFKSNRRNLEIIKSTNPDQLTPRTGRQIVIWLKITAFFFAIILITLIIVGVRLIYSLLS